MKAVKKPLGVLVGLMALGFAGVGSATAQGVYFNGPGFYGPRYYYYGPRYYAPGLSLSQVTRVVRSAGITTVGAPVRRGRTYLVTGIDSGGNRLRVVVDAYDGVIVSVRPVLALRAPVPPRDPRDAVVRPYDEAAVVPESAPGRQAAAPGAAVAAPLPPRPMPDQRMANAPATTGSIAGSPAQAARTPIPRPRPLLAANSTPAATASTPAQAPAASSPAVAATPVDAPPAATRSGPPTRMVPVAPLD